MVPPFVNKQNQKTHNGEFKTCCLHQGNKSKQGVYLSTS